MSTKRKTKAQREEELRGALLRRVHDVYCGAFGGKWDSEINGDSATAENLSNIIPALKAMLGEQFDGVEYLWQPHCLKYFDNPEKATDFLFDQGFRA